jgi:hypothetical protein
VFFAGITFTLILCFTRSFLRTCEHRGLDRWIKLLLGLSLFLIVAPFTVPISMAYQIGVTIIFAFPALCMVGCMITGVLPYHSALLEGISLGIAGDALLLALALADRIRILQKAKLLAEDAARTNLEVRQEELEQLVAERGNCRTSTHRSGIKPG